MTAFRRPRAAWPGAVLAAATLVAAGPEPRAADRPHVRFVDVHEQAGLTRVLLAGRPGKDHLLDSAGAGAAWIDYDRDGRLDLYLPNGWKLDGSTIVEKGRHALYRGLPGGRFEDVTDAAGVAGEGRWAQGAYVADYDDDGWPDIFVTNFGPNVLYRNKGDGTFENVAARVGLESPGWNTGASFFDADRDGDLDVFVAGYIAVSEQDVLQATRTLPWKGVEMVAFGPFGLKGAPDRYFRNDGGHFVEATAQAGLVDKALAFGFATRAGDMDGDGSVDLFVANDSDPNYLYRNDGKGVFRDVATWAGCAFDEKGSAQASMGVAWGDVTGDGLFDLFVTNFAMDFSTLYGALPGGLYDDVSRATGIGPMTFKNMGWGTAFVDLDNDADLDIVVAQGHIYPQIDAHQEFEGAYAQRNLLAENLGAGASPLFRDVTAEAGPGFEALRSSRAVAAGDYDNDGDVDLAISNLDAPPTLLRNDSAGGSWLTVSAIGRTGLPGPIGTVVTVKAGGRTQVRDIAAGDSYLSTHDPRPHFGLGTATTADEVTVRWPDGTASAMRGVPTRQILTVRQPSAPP
jgi:hypothetical protein